MISFFEEAGREMALTEIKQDEDWWKQLTQLHVTLYLALLIAASCQYSFVKFLFVSFFDDDPILNGTDIIWSVCVIFSSHEAYNVECADDANIWVFCMVEVMIIPAIGLLFWIAKRKYGDAMFMGLFQAVPATLTLIVCVWGVLLWANMTSECFEFYSVNFMQLLILFYIDVVMLVAGLISVGILVCVVIGSLGVLIARKGQT
jgi:hypothetical protein